MLRLSMLGDRWLLMLMMLPMMGARWPRLGLMRLPMMGGRLLLLGLLKLPMMGSSLLLLGLLKTHRAQLNLIPGSQRLQMVPRHHALGLGYTGFRGYGLEPLLDAGLLAGGVGPWRR